MRYTLVRHSAWTDDHNGEFMHAVETRAITANQADKVRSVGGVIYDTFQEADVAEEAANYPPEVKGLIPHVRGSWAPIMIGGSAVYVPPKGGSA